MKIVIDTSIVIAVLLNEKNKNRILEITTGTELFAPASLHWEIGNVFSAMFRRDRITYSEAVKALKYYQEIPIRFVDISLVTALRISDDYCIYAYDSYFIAACKEINCPLISLDSALSEIASNEGINVIKV